MGDEDVDERVLSWWYGNTADRGFVNGSDTSSSRRVLPPAKPSGGSCSLCDSDLPSSAADDARLLSLRLLLRLSHVTIPIKVQAMTTVITTTAISHDTPREPEGTPPPFCGAGIVVTLVVVVVDIETKH